mgnify:CR=1 FL=1
MCELVYVLVWKKIRDQRFKVAVPGQWGKREAVEMFCDPREMKVFVMCWICVIVTARVSFSWKFSPCMLAVTWLYSLPSVLSHSNSSKLFRHSSPGLRSNAPPFRFPSQWIMYCICNNVGDRTEVLQIFECRVVSYALNLLQQYIFGPWIRFKQWIVVVLVLPPSLPSTVFF